MATVDEVVGGTVGDLNVSLDGVSNFLPLLLSQLDASISLGLGPAKFDLATQLSAALAAQATVAVQVSDPTASIRLALAAVTQLQAALTASLALPTVSLDVTAELSATAALAATLSAKLGIIEGLISASLSAKAPALNFLENLEDLSVGPAILLSFDGISDGTDMSAMGSLIQTKLQSPVSSDGHTINPSDNVSGILILTTAGTAYTTLLQIMAGIA